MPAELRRRHPLVLIGGHGWLQDKINAEIERARAAGNNIVRPSRYVPDSDLPAIYSGAAAFVFPSLYEGFGIPPLEAMACGVPVLLSDSSSLPEAGGQAAIYADPSSSADIAAKIRSILEDEHLRQRMIRDGLEHVKSFSWKRSANTLLEAIDKLAGTL